MKKLLYILPVLLLLISCQKENEKKVSYLITKSVSGFSVNYRNVDGTLIKENIEVSSAEDRWQYEFMAEEGDIVFVSAIYKDINSAINVQVIVDGKVYKQGSSKQDTVKYVTVSGTVPFE
jgi:choline kinase